MILVLIPVSVVVIAAAVAAFIWAVDTGQYEDVGRAGEAALFEESDTSPPNPEPPVS